MQAHPRRARPQPQRLGDLPRTLALQEMLKHDLAILFGHARERGVEFALELGQARLVRGVTGCGLWQTRRIRPPPARTALLARPHRQEPEQPRQQRPLRVPVPRPLDRDEEGALDQVLGVVPIRREMRRKRPELADRPVEDPGQRPCVTVLPEALEVSLRLAHGPIGRRARKTSQESPHECPRAQRLPPCGGKSGRCASGLVSAGGPKRR